VNKKYILIGMIGALAISMCGCGQEAEKEPPIEISAITVDDNDKGDVVLDNQVASSMITEESELTGEPEAGTDLGELSVDDCTLWQLGVDVENRKLNDEVIDMSYTFLFPSASYITSESAGYLKAEGIVVEYMDISLSPVAEAKPGRDMLAENDNGFVSRTVKYDNNSSYKATYTVVIGEDKSNINLEAKIKASSTEDEQAVFRAFVEAYVPAFEESLITNLQ